MLHCFKVLAKLNEVGTYSDTHLHSVSPRHIFIIIIIIIISIIIIIIILFMLKIFCCKECSLIQVKNDCRKQKGCIGLGKTMISRALRRCFNFDVRNRVTSSSGLGERLRDRSSQGSVGQSHRLGHSSTKQSARGPKDLLKQSRHWEQTGICGIRAMSGKVGQNFSNIRHGIHEKHCLAHIRLCECEGSGPVFTWKFERPETNVKLSFDTLKFALGSDWIGPKASNFKLFHSVVKSEIHDHGITALHTLEDPGILDRNHRRNGLFSSCSGYSSDFSIFPSKEE